jgi:haloalkane dehalogenase
MADANPGKSTLAALCETHQGLSPCLTQLIEILLNDASTKHSEVSAVNNINSEDAEGRIPEMEWKSSPKPEKIRQGPLQEKANMISSTFSHQKKRRRVLDRELAYVEVGEGDPIVFLHGNPTSSYLWRNVLPHLQPLGHCIAPDLLGMGDSDKLPNSGPGSYRFVEHRRYLDALLEALDVRERVTLVIHDWGSALGFDWANRHRKAVKGIAFMEAIVRPQGWDHWDVMNMRPFLQALRSDAGEKMVLEENFFIEKILPGAVLRTLTAEEKAEYRRPFAEPGEGRRPTLTWPREIPIEGKPADVNAIVAAYAEWLATSDLPKLFIKAEPGALLGGGANLDTVRAWPAQTEVTVAGVHFIQEDSPDEIGQAIASWMRTLK